jgi:hypothetical protein
VTTLHLGPITLQLLGLGHRSYRFISLTHFRRDASALVPIRVHEQVLGWAGLQVVLCNESAALLREAVDEVQSVAVAQPDPIRLTRADADVAYEGLMYMPSRSRPHTCFAPRV